MLLPLKKKSNFFENRKKNFMIEYLGCLLLNAVCGERKESTRTKASRKFHPDQNQKSEILYLDIIWTLLYRSSKNEISSMMSTTDDVF